ncbi:uncharacterized protein LOC113341033 [Papaver somniferum]|uniref:uncharacterized protein LOC113341033 n=1 Tax=Papaver somniferum TaxID=3469 RepID=UPI000E6FDD25|nr:uncharacterized protein LOC113341033 [Papaver somniferum]
MALTGVKMCEDVWLTCLTHALSTETEEIMGLLLGDIHYSKNGSATALIWGAAPQTRSDRRKDRVETNPEQLAAASAQAERMTLTTGRTTRVIGWYHSHPHITVLPSHVDVRTQGMYQMLDTGFTGLIFSCFNEDAQKTGRIQVIAFQSLDGKLKYMATPVSVVPVNSTPVIEVESSLSTSENVLPRSASGRPEISERDTASSGTTKASGKAPNLEGFFAHADHPGRDKMGGGSHQMDELQDAIVDLDPMDINESMQEALHRSTMELSGAEYVRKEVPLLVLPTSALLKLESPLTSFTDLQRVLYEEEKAAYKQAVLQNMQDGKVHPLAFIHHTSTYQTSMCKLMEYCLSPSISALQDRLRENEIRLKMLTEEAKALEIESTRGSDSSMMSSPRGSPSHGLRGNAAMGQRDLYPPVESVGVRSPSGIGSRSRRS